MDNNLTLREWIENFKEGIYEEADVQTQIAAGWYDWFCRSTSLKNKTIKMGNIIKQIKDGGKVNLDETYVWFKNNCPLNGPLYDDFRIADIESGDTIFTIQINSFREEMRYTVYGKKNYFSEPLFKTNSSRALVKWLNEV